MISANESNLNLSPKKKYLESSASLFRALAHPTRIKIIEMIHEKGSMTVTEIYVALDMEQAIVSNHLAILRKKGILNTRREGKMIHYSVDEDWINIVLSWLKICEENAMV